MHPTFASVFPTAVLDHTTPTPVATPDLAFTGLGQSFGGFTSPVAQKHHQPLSAAQVQVKRNISWSTATRFLSLSHLASVDFSTAKIPNGPHKIKTREVEEAIEFLLSGEGSQGQSDDNWDLVEWYMLEVRTHFVDRVAPGMQEAWSSQIPCSQAIQYLRETAQRLTVLQSVYEAPVSEHILPAIGVSKRRNTLEPGASAERRQLRILSKFGRRLHSLFVHAIPANRLSQTISQVTYDYACKMFKLNIEEEAMKPHSSGPPSGKDKELMSVLRLLQKVGLGGDRAQRSFAYAMDKLMNEFVVSHFMKVDWENLNSVTKKLRRWVNHGFSPFVRDVLSQFGVEQTVSLADESQRWLDMALARLGRARIALLFDYIVKWDCTLGAILDIKEYITEPRARLHLTTDFSHQISRRLLHAGATTTHILNIYISIIRAFGELDSKGVLLDRVARPIRRYLCDREDTARIIVASLLADIEDPATGEPLDPGGEISVEIAKEMSNPITAFDEYDVDMDWENMEWTPDPIDAGPEYTKEKSSDVTASLLSLYDREDFINELKTILGEHLLKNDENSRFEKEERLLELFKHRLGSDKLQACEVMLHDVQQSRRINAMIHRYPGYSSALAQSDSATELNAQILSSFFWPSLKDDVFAVPPPIKTLQDGYEKGFEGIKDMRKLEWLHALGRVTVELQLDDRKIAETVPTWTASVIYAFQGDGAVKRSVDDLVEELSMDEALVRNALVFWQGKHVLRASDPSASPSPSTTYTVIETLSTESSAETSAAQEAQAVMEAETAVSAVKSQADIMDENRDLYRQFVVGMLTNQGNLAVMKIWMMLRVVVPGGFPFGIEEVRTLLGRMAEEGTLVGQGDVFGVKRE